MLRFEVLVFSWVFVVVDYYVLGRRLILLV